MVVKLEMEQSQVTKPKRSYSLERRYPIAISINLSIKKEWERTVESVLILMNRS